MTTTILPPLPLPVAWVSSLTPAQFLAGADIVRLLRLRKAFVPVAGRVRPWIDHLYFEYPATGGRMFQIIRLPLVAIETELLRRPDCIPPPPTKKRRSHRRRRR